MKKLLIALLLIIPITFVWAQKNLVERVAEATSKSKNPVTARQEMINEATEKVSEDLVKEIIGEAKFKRNKSLIQSKIIKRSARYVPYAKPGELQALDPEGYKMNVTLKVSVDDLQSLLLENGLFYESDSTPVVLPAIRILDRVNSKSYSWWVESDLSQKAFLVKEGRLLNLF